MDNTDIKNAFKLYKESIFTIKNDLHFWKVFLKSSIDNYTNQEEFEIFSSIFSSYDYQHNTNDGYLKTEPAKKLYSINTLELEAQRKEFFNWIINLSIIKMYNSMELLFLQSIQLAYFPKLPNPILGKHQAKSTKDLIKQCLYSNDIAIETKNNRYLVDFLDIKSDKIRSFLKKKMNIDLATTWENFFYFISILRNIIAHNGMIVNSDASNEIKSNAKDVFDRYFTLNENMILTPFENEFGNFLTYANSLAVNICKFIFNEDDLEFIGLF